MAENTVAELSETQSGDLLYGVPAIAEDLGSLSVWNIEALADIMFGGITAAEYADATKVEGISIDSALPADWAARELQGRCAVQGNLDPLMLVCGGDVMRRESARILEVLGAGPFIFNLGHGIVPQTPPEHVAQLADLIRDWKP